MGKTTSLIESQHHHLLHCLEKTTVSPAHCHLPLPDPGPLPRVRTRLMFSSGAQESKSIPFRPKSCDEDFLIPQNKDPKEWSNH